MKKEVLYLMLVLFFSVRVCGQDSLDISGQVSGFINYAPDNDLSFMTGGRYLPDIQYIHSFHHGTQLALEGSANLYGNLMFHPFDTVKHSGGIKPYRLWLRYSGNRFELRLGLQKINFGSATLLRPLQWFDDIDPSDPLQFSNGVYGLLGRYYFLNNANIWLWALYGNENPRGFELVKNNRKYPEMGGRVQLPVPRGEVALTYHHRTASSMDLSGVSAYERIPEDKIGLDGKWDLAVGLWFEASTVLKEKDLDRLTNQTMIDVGTDYTFGLGNGLNVSLEHLVMSMDETPLAFSQTYNITAALVSYPLGLFDRLSGYLFYLWNSDDTSFLVHYEHAFNRITGYVMAYYTPTTEQNPFTERYLQQLTGPGIRIMVVFNH